MRIHNSLFMIAVAIATISCSNNTKNNSEKTVPIYTVDSNATYETKSLLYNLRETSKKGVMFGHDDALVYGIGWEYKDKPGNCDVYNVVNDYPAVFNWDLGYLEVDSVQNLDSVDFTLYREQIIRAHKMGGVNTISWHARNPVTDGIAWDTAGNVVARILPGGDTYPRYRTWLEKIGVFMNSLVDETGKPIPVIFRPYHEHTGSWFWWGEALCSDEEYVALWRSTVSFLRDTMNVHNLLYAYSPNLYWSKDEYMKKYPGDEWVDILGCDVYDLPQYNLVFAENLPRCLNILKEVATEKNKVYALTETGRSEIPEANWWTEAMFKHVKNSGVAYLVVWRNRHMTHYYAPYPGQISADDFVKFYNDSASLFLKDIPNMYSVESVK